MPSPPWTVPCCARIRSVSSLLISPGTSIGTSDEHAATPATARARNVTELLRIAPRSLCPHRLAERPSPAAEADGSEVEPQAYHARGRGVTGVLLFGVGEI